jgi:hypothetical protein
MPAGPIRTESETRLRFPPPRARRGNLRRPFRCSSLLYSFGLRVLRPVTDPSVLFGDSALHAPPGNCRAPAPIRQSLSK